jgi:hypothetical protein
MRWALSCPHPPPPRPQLLAARPNTSGPTMGPGRMAGQGQALPSGTAFDSMSKFTLDAPGLGGLHRRFASAGSSSSLLARRLKAPPMALEVDDSPGDGVGSVTGTAGSSVGSSSSRSRSLDRAASGSGGRPSPLRGGRRTEPDQGPPGARYGCGEGDGDGDGEVEVEEGEPSPGLDPGAGTGVGVGVSGPPLRDTKDVEPARGATKSLLKVLQERRLQQLTVGAGGAEVRGECCSWLGGWMCVWVGGQVGG